MSHLSTILARRDFKFGMTEEFAGAVHNFDRPMSERAKARRVVGPYCWSPSKAGSGRGFYMESGRGFECARHGSGFRLRIEAAPDRFGFRGGSYAFNEFGEDITPIVARLPRGRGFLAGWTMGEGMCASLEPEIYQDEDEAARAAHECARIAAERQEEYEREENEKLD